MRKCTISNFFFLFCESCVSCIKKFILRNKLIQHFLHFIPRVLVVNFFTSKVQKHFDIESKQVQYHLIYTKSVFLLLRPNTELLSKSNIKKSLSRTVTTSLTDHFIKSTYSIFYPWHPSPRKC
jgi:hypothetical protein